MPRTYPALEVSLDMLEAFISKLKMLELDWDLLKFTSCGTRLPSSCWTSSHVKKKLSAPTHLWVLKTSI